MIAPEQCVPGTPVVFGRERGEKTRGTIVELLRSRVKIRQEEARGVHRVGTIWKVPFELISPINVSATALAQQVQAQPFVLPNRTSPFAGEGVKIGAGAPDDRWVLDHECELTILQQILSGLSPENLTCDGEASRAYVMQRRAELTRKYRAVEVLCDRAISETEGWDLCMRLSKLLESQS